MLLRNIFLKNLRDRRKALFWWSFGMILFALFICAFYPTVQESAAELETYMANMPEALIAAFGGTGSNIASPEGYLNVEFFSMMLPMMFIIYAIGFGGGVIAGEEEAGTLDLLLANPISRWRVLLEKFLAMVAGMTILSFMSWLGLVAGAYVYDMNIGLGQLAAATFSSVLLSFSFGVIALAVSCLTGRRGISMGIATALAVGTYLLYVLAQVAEPLEKYQKLSPFYWHLAPNPLANGLKLGNMAVFIGTIAVFLIIALIAFQRRDLAV
ncbi:ABC transporter permease subunit [Candidatus Oleimmundimicrobium sp.]|uniref:ABC transporter permease subunit n=1 Tax=Candidatus Oleimmundimicrobium sp. TaxID=3060597 RepID=UPI0027186AAA|nr:ABC transporter permease subunit [Candidatus Oleimmundimicrobium sp.]MDO8886644.1 ABC transporter permease subunit [Candidatus Oleimmundimicrobium sp.]